MVSGSGRGGGVQLREGTLFEPAEAFSVFAMKVQESVMPRVARAFRIPAVLESPPTEWKPFPWQRFQKQKFQEADWEEGDGAVWLTNAEVEESISVLKGLSDKRPGPQDRQQRKCLQNQGRAAAFPSGMSFLNGFS